MKKRILIIGPENSGQQQLISLLEGKMKPENVGSIVYHNECIHVPSSYFRSPWMTNHIIATQQNAYCILMLLNAHRKFRVYSPNFAKVFRIPSVGIIVRDTEQDSEKIDDCYKELTEASVSQIYNLDLQNEANCQKLLDKIKLLKREK